MQDEICFRCLAQKQDLHGMLKKISAACCVLGALRPGRLLLSGCLWIACTPDAYLCLWRPSQQRKASPAYASLNTLYVH